MAYVYVPGTAKVDFDARCEYEGEKSSVYEEQQCLGSYSVYDDSCVVDEKPSVHQRSPARMRLETPASLPHDHWQLLQPFPKQKTIYACTERTKTKFEKPHPSLITELGKAIVERDWLATQYAWHLLKCYTHKTSLNLHALAITTNLIHFLLFRAQLPDLFCAIVHQSTLANWRSGLDNYALHDAEKGEIVPIVAAVMEAVHYVRREGNHTFADDVEQHKKKREGWEGHGFKPGTFWWRSEVSSPPGYGNDTWWHRALTVLISALPRRPSLVVRFTNQANKGRDVSLLERAVLCSELSTVMFEHLLVHCEFSQRDLALALDAALFVTNLRGTTRPRLAGLLYGELRRLCPVVTNPTLLKTASMHYLEAAWTELMIVSPTQRVVQLHTTQERNLLIQECGDASEYEAVMSSFLEVHDRDGAETATKNEEWVVRHLCCYTMEVALLMHDAPTYLIKHLLHLAYLNDFLGAYFELPSFLLVMVSEHPSAWTPTLKNAFRTYPTKERQDALVVEAMGACVMHRLREGVDLILDAIVRLPDELKTARALDRFLCYLCRPWPVGKNQFGGMVANRDKIRRIWETLRMYLVCGGTVSEWDPEVLASGLKEASRIRSGVAVEVFVSKPYSVQPHPDDTFSLAVLEAVLAPGEQEVLATGERFGKRQRGEAVAQEEE